VPQTEFQFTLPEGYVDNHGNMHRKGVMRLATAADEILPLKDPRVRQNPAYRTIVILSRVICKLGTLGNVNPRVIEGLLASDLAYLQRFYNRLNDGAKPMKVVCPKCDHSFSLEPESDGE